MSDRRMLPNPLKILVLCAAMVLLSLPAQAQRGRADEPTAFSPNTVPTQPEPEQSTGMKVFSAVCWYLPNRILDITDIPAIYVASGDGNGISLRFTKYLAASWIHNDSVALGWVKRPSSIPFGVSYDERYFGFLAAQGGEMVNDPTEIGISAHVIALGANVAVSLSETLDAVLGFVGVDLMGDDHGPTFNDYTHPEPQDWGQKPPPENILPPEQPRQTPEAAVEDAPVDGSDATPPVGGAETGSTMPTETVPAPAAPAAPAPTSEPVPAPATPAPPPPAAVDAPTDVVPAPGA